MKIYVQSITNFLLCDKFLHNRQGFRNNEFIPCFVPQIAEHNLMRLQAHKTTKFLLNANLCTVNYKFSILFTNCITVKSLEILLYSYHVFVPQPTKLLLNVNSLFTVNYKIFTTVKSSEVTNSFHS